MDLVGVERPVALVFGNELEGLSDAAIRLADGRFRVPMFGFVESLNISVAAALSLYELMGRMPRGGAKRGLVEEDQRRLRAAWYAASVRGADQILARARLRLPVVSTEELQLIDD